jgi:hypothetical protein
MLTLLDTAMELPVLALQIFRNAHSALTTVAIMEVAHMMLISIQYALALITLAVIVLFQTVTVSPPVTIVAPNQCVGGAVSLELVCLEMHLDR